MAKLTFVEPLDLVTLDLTFPIGGIFNSLGFQLFSGTGWRIDVTLAANDIATGFDLFMTGSSGFAKIVGITDINRPVVAPVGGTIQSLLWLVLDQDDTLTGTDSTQGDAMSGYKGNDTLAGLGGGDLLLGGQGRDTLLGGQGNDIARGGIGKDDLKGNFGNDRLFGGKGDDMLTGGQGNDNLTGGAGADIFLFKRGDGSDKITDFSVGEDLISIGRGADELADLKFTQAGDDVLLSFRNVEIRVMDMVVADLEDSSNFIF